MVTKHKPHKLAIADSSALISLAITTDANHPIARSIFATIVKAEVLIIIPSEVFAETLTILGKKFNHMKAVAAATLFLETDIFLIAPTTTIMRQDALKEFEQMPTGVSYTDCLVMAVAHLHSTPMIFGFDKIFRQKGYHLPK